MFPHINIQLVLSVLVSCLQLKKLRNQNAKSSERNNWGVYLIVKDQTHWKIKKNEYEQSVCDPGRVL